MRIVVYGGSFNPFCKNHLDVVSWATTQGDEVWVIPSYAHPEKSLMIDFEHRLVMARLAVGSELWPVPVWVSDIERTLFQEGMSKIFTYHLLRRLAAMHPENTFVFAIGPDIDPSKWELGPEAMAEFEFIRVPDMGTHATQVREWIRTGDSQWRNFVPTQVQRYITWKSLYGDFSHEI